MEVPILFLWAWGFFRLMGFFKRGFCNSASTGECLNPPGANPLPLVAESSGGLGTRHFGGGGLERSLPDETAKLTRFCNATSQKSSSGKIKTYTGTSPPLFSKKAMPWGKKMAGTNEFACFRCKSICTSGGPESGRKKSEKCLPAGTGTKIYFSSSPCAAKEPLNRSSESKIAPIDARSLRFGSQPSKSHWPLLLSAFQTERF